MRTLILLSLFTLTSCQSVSDQTYGALQELITGELSESSISNGLKKALEKGTSSACKDLAKNGGYSQNALYSISIPQDLQKFTDTLKKIGLRQQITMFENKMNEAAEDAVTKAAPIFFEAINDMTLKDVNNILMGNKNAATNFFRKATYDSLFKTYKPIVSKKMAEIGLIEQFQSLIQKYNAIPFTQDLSFKLDDYITKQALDGLFDLLEESERDIRQNPAARTSDLLQKVFALQDKQ